MGWQFFIDVGGTFTDVVARRPDGRLVTHKLLSSGAVRGTGQLVGVRSGRHTEPASGRGQAVVTICDPGRAGDPEGFWVGYRFLPLALTGARGELGPEISSLKSEISNVTPEMSRRESGISTLKTQTPNRETESSDLRLRPSPEHPGGESARDSALETARGPAATVTGFDAASGELCLKIAGPEDLVAEFAQTLSGPEPFAYELRSDEEAPIVAIRYLMGLRLHEAAGPVLVRLGTTRATNALLERKGARVAFVITRGFADILKIGYQDRPDLFQLHIQKRDELAECSIEIDERMAADGRPILAPDVERVHAQLEEAKAAGIGALAICLLHSYVNPEHEERVARVADSIGFDQISVSSRLSRLQKIIPRGDTTVLDAYLSGVVRSYVASLRQSLPEARIQLMTSSGGLIDAAAVTGKDTILSGPAGGVIGCAQVSRLAGFHRVIGLDMGGTSTDVCRIEPPPMPFEYQHETVKAGIRIQTPVLAIETVAAGGGSICGFDGHRLFVGPHSAGADPGPACYGRGGPLTITDVNLFLGRIAPEHFPFRLDREIVERRLGELCGQVNGGAGSAMSPAELAEGFVKIANANMAAAIRKVSIAKGYDPAEYTLTTFGGAGGQHACAIARLLGIHRILCSPFAGVLSALGIGEADVRRVGQRSVRIPCGDGTERELEPVFAGMTQTLVADLAAEGVAASDLVAPWRTVDACYADQATLVTVPADPVDGIRSRFEAVHEQLYGYRHAGRAIEIRTVRVELGEGTRGEGRRNEGTKGPSTQRQPTRDLDAHREPTTITKSTDYATTKTPKAVSRSQLSLGPFSGPVVIAEGNSTTYVEHGWMATLLDHDDVLLTDTQSAPREEEISTECDPIRLELFNNQFAAIAEQMGETLRRTALSTNVKERLDFSCAVFTPDGDLVVNAPHIPVHLGGMSDCVKCLIEDVGAFEPGDVCVTNDPFRGGSHLNDITVVTPVHDDASAAVIFFVASRAHHAEIGGKRPGSMPPDSTRLAEEGVVIRAFRCVKAGQFLADELRDMLTRRSIDNGESRIDNPLYPSRAPDENLADIAAQIAANQRGVRDLRELVARCGLEVVHAYMGHIQAAAAEKARRAIARLPRGTHRFTDALDDGAEIRLAVTITGTSATFDFAGTAPVVAGNLNANRSIVTSAVLYCLRCLMDEEIPLNSGVLAPVRILLPECFLNPPSDPDPRKCPAVAAGNVETSQRVVDTIFGALQTVAASQGTMNNLLIGNDRFGYYETICGGAGAGASFRGADAVHTHMTNTRLTDPEVLESRYPLRLARFAIRRGSGGAGEFHGGDGVIREIEFLEPLEVSIISQRRTRPPYGLHGGQPGAVGRNTLIRLAPASLTTAASGRTLPGIVSFSAVLGDRVIIETPGGGGFGAAHVVSR